jgi:AraC-like DNA-binding protein
MTEQYSQLLSMRDGLGAPFLFVEERRLTLKRGEQHSLINNLPKILLILEGEINCQVGTGAVTRFDPGTLMVNLRQERQVYTSAFADRSSRVRLFRVTLQPDLVERALSRENSQDDFLSICLSLMPSYGVMQAPIGTEWKDKLGRLKYWLGRREPESRHRIQNLLRELFLDIRQSQDRVETGSRMEGLCARIDAYLESNLDKEIHLDDLSRQLDRSSEHLARLYKLERGKTIFQQLTHLRTGKARYYLLCTDWSVSKIGTACGFSTAALFSRTFREQAAQAPRDYRSQQGFQRSMES